MRDSDRCPVCGGKVGRVEEIEIGEFDALKYWHTDLPEKSEFCIEKCDGETATVVQGKKGLTGPRA